MPLNTPSNLYSGYAQVFNEAPHTAFRARLLAQHQAKMDALDEYYRKLPLTINEKGVRDQERPDINNSMLGIKSFYIQNKDKIRKGDGAAAFNYEKMIRDHQDLVAQSQAAGLVDTQVGKLKFNPSVQYMFQSPETVEQLAAHHLPISDPNHVDFDLETFSAPPKPLVKDTYMKRYDKLKFDDYKNVTNNPDGTQTITNTPKPSKEALDSILAGATFDYIHDPSVTKAVDELGAADNTNPYNRIFKENFGRDIQTPIDVNAAFILANKLPQPSTEKIQTDRYAMMDKQLDNSFKRMKKQHEYAQSNIRLAAGLRKDAKHDEDVDNADSVLSDVYDKISQAEKESETLSKVGKLSMGYDEKLPLKIADANLLKTFSGIKKDGTTPVPPDEVNFDKAKDQFNLVYHYAKGDEVIPISAREYVKLKVKETYPNKDIGFINNLVDKTITKHGSLYKAIQMYNPENKQTEAAPQTKKYSIKGKPYTHDDLKKLGYTDEQINQAIKMGTIK